MMKFHLECVFEAVPTESRRRYRSGFTSSFTISNHLSQTNALSLEKGELKDGQPLFPGDSDLDQLYRIQTMLGPVPADQKEMFSNHPGNIGIYFNIKKPTTLEARWGASAC
jgi:hypothetical protein